MSDIPWVEKYRPKCFDNIVLNDVNQSIFNNILKKSIFLICYFMDHLGLVRQQL